MTQDTTEMTPTIPKMDKARVWFMQIVKREIRAHHHNDPEIEALIREFLGAFDQTLAIAKDPSMILRASEASIANCVQSALRLRLAPGGTPPRAYLVPREGSLSYSIAPAGIRELASRFGQLVKVYRLVEGDEYSVEENGGLTVRYRPALCADRSTRKEIGYLGWVERASDRAQLDYCFMDPMQIAKRRAVSKMSKVWEAWPEEMALKTVLHRLVAEGKIVLTNSSDAEIHHVLDAAMVDVEDAPPVVSGVAALDRVLALPAPVDAPTQDLSETTRQREAAPREGVAETEEERYNRESDERFVREQGQLPLSK